MFVIRKRAAEGRTPRAPAPTILYAYGAFGLPETPRFDSAIIPWLEQGGTYAIANIRGGGEYGEAWHQVAVGRGRQVTFDDFAAAAEYLATQGYTTRDQLIAKGYSHGGLLVAAALTQRPELYRAVIRGAPLTDMIRFPPIGPGETLDWRGRVSRGRGRFPRATRVLAVSQRGSGARLPVRPGRVGR